MNKLMKCELCGSSSPFRKSNLCERCEISIFQIETILTEYIKNNETPQWLIDGMIEIASWAYNSAPRGAGYFNVANEIVEIFAIEREEIIPLEKLSEINYTNLPQNRILKLLENAQIIGYDYKNIFPGPISRKLIEIRWEGYEMNSPEIKMKVNEMHGIISVSVTYSLIKEGNIKPQKALALFKLISQIILNSDSSDGIVKTISDYDVDIAFNKLLTRQKNKMKRDMCGLGDGEIKIIKDKDIEGKMPLKENVITYAENMRERYRSREREERVY